MSMKKELPLWSIVAALAAALAIVGLLFIKGGTGDASKQDIVKIRQNQRNHSAGAPSGTSEVPSRRP